MFTGLIHNLGRIESIKIKNKAAHIAIRFKNREKKVLEGESISTSGVCLTAKNASSSGFEADLLPETLQATHLGSLQPGDWVNIERSLKEGDPIGGHFVSGHVDAVGRISDITKRGGNWSLWVHAPKSIISGLAVKGSIACDGISLTVQDIQAKSFKVAVIPHTLSQTTLQFRKTGDRLNLEIDMLSRYSGMKRRTSKISEPRLRAQGF